MTEAQAKATLQSMVASSDEPVLSSSEVDDLLLYARRPDADNNTPHAKWRAQDLFSVGDLIEPRARNGHFYRCAVAGTTAGSDPAWPLGAGATVSDGQVSWVEAGLDRWHPTYDLYSAAAEGWRQKAGKVSMAYTFHTPDRQISQRAEMHAHALAQAAAYAKKVAAAVKQPTRDSGAAWEAVVYA